MMLMILKGAASVAIKYAAARRENQSLQRQLNASLAGQELQSSVIAALSRENEALRRKCSARKVPRDHGGRFTNTKSARAGSANSLPVRSTAK